MQIFYSTIYIALDGQCLFGTIKLDNYKKKSLTTMDIYFCLYMNKVT